MNIAFFYEQTDFRLSQENTVQSWVEKIIEFEGYSLESLNYIFCSDEYLLKINIEYLKHNTYTDIITFDNSELENTIESDIFISIDRVKENSNAQSVNFEDELSRVLVHGVLHLMGWNDKSDSMKQEMRIKEDACLSLR
jgi:probable rRNA maturation factor